MPTPAEAATQITDEAAAIMRAMDGVTDHTQASDMAGAIHEKLNMALAILERSGDDVSQERARVHFVRGELLRSLGDAAFFGKKAARETYQLAVENYQKAIDERPGPSPRANYGMGQCYASLGKKDAALVALGAAAAEAEMCEDHQLVVEAHQMAERVQRGEAKSGGCYIATACYGSYDHADVVVFRHFRDTRLAQSTTGRAIISAYYAVSPQVAARLVTMPWLNSRVRRWLLEPLARRLGG